MEQMEMTIARYGAAKMNCVEVLLLEGPNVSLRV